VLFSYSPLGYQDNWLHETILEMLGDDFDRIDAGHARLNWPRCIPAARREVLKSRRALRDRRVTLLTTYEALNDVERGLIKAAITQQNAIPAMFDANIPCLALNDLPAAAQEPIKQFFECAFGLLAGLGLRDTNYQTVYHQLKYKVCAYCGVEILDAPDQKRESLDHYLPIAKYPFAGANFRNLSPMGSKCNSRYKLQQNILFDPADGSRRRCNDPYDSPQLDLILAESEPFAGNRVKLSVCPKWVIGWQGGDPQKVQTWEDVFAISNRYVSSSLDPNFRDWIDHFCQWATRQPGCTADRQALCECLLDFAAIIVPEGFSDSAFLKRATILMLAHHCGETGHGPRIFAWLRDQIEESRALAA
jgi:hypothetical protein